MTKVGAELTAARRPVAVSPAIALPVAVRAGAGLRMVAPDACVSVLDRSRPIWNAGRVSEPEKRSPPRFWGDDGYVNRVAGHAFCARARSSMCAAGGRGFAATGPGGGDRTGLIVALGEAV